MTHELPALPYAMNALAPHMSEETLTFHYGKHHKTYVEKLNGLIVGTEWEEASLEDIITRAPDGAIVNNAAQIWNHTFFWQCLAPAASSTPTDALAAAIDANFESIEKFQEAFTQSALSLFGSGWTWLVKKPDGTLAIENTSNAGNPLRTKSGTPLLVVDVWEHAYYIDYRNARPEFLKHFWSLVHWDFVSGELEK